MSELQLLLDDDSVVSDSNRIQLVAGSPVRVRFRMSDAAQVFPAGQTFLAAGSIDGSTSTDHLRFAPDDSGAPGAWQDYGVGWTTVIEATDLAGDAVWIETDETASEVYYLFDASPDYVAPTSPAPRNVITFDTAFDPYAVMSASTVSPTIDTDTPIDGAGSAKFVGSDDAVLSWLGTPFTMHSSGVKTWGRWFRFSGSILQDPNYSEPMLFGIGTGPDGNSITGWTLPRIIIRADGRVCVLNNAAWLPLYSEPLETDHVYKLTVAIDADSGTETCAVYDTDGVTLLKDPTDVSAGTGWRGESLTSVIGMFCGGSAFTMWVDDVVDGA
jgi:hypothetical protein